MREEILNVTTEEMDSILDEIREEGATKLNIVRFLKEYIKGLRAFLDGKVSVEDTADLAICVFIRDDKLFDKFGEFDKELAGLRGAMGITDPDWSDEKRKKYIKDLIKLAEKLIEKYS